MAVKAETPHRTWQRNPIGLKRTSTGRKGERVRDVAPGKQRHTNADAAVYQVQRKYDG